MWKRKISIREQYGTLGHFLRGDEPCHYLGQRLIEGTNFYARREWRGVRDTTYAFVHWAKLWVTMAGLIARNPVRMAKGRRIRLLNRVFRKRTGMTAFPFKDAFLKES